MKTLKYENYIKTKFLTWATLLLFLDNDSIIKDFEETECIFDQIYIKNIMPEWFEK